MDRRNKQTVNVSHKQHQEQRSSLQKLYLLQVYKIIRLFKGDRGYKRNRHYKYLPAVIAALFASPVNAETVGGVSATASPIANSSGSVTNQAIQVLQGPYITNTYGGGIQCQGPTRNFTPYVTGTASAQKPYEPYLYGSCV